MSGPTYDDVVKLLGHSAYNPAIVPQLEAYVNIALLPFHCTYFKPLIIILLWNISLNICVFVPLQVCRVVGGVSVCRFLAGVWTD
jgi:hypothetical protein